VGVIRDDASGQLLIDKFGEKASIEPVASFEQNVKKLNKGRVDLVAYGEKTAWSVIAGMGLPLSRYKVVYVIGEEQACFAFHRSVADPLIARFQQSLDRVIATPAFFEIQERYFYSPLVEDRRSAKSSNHTILLR
jgi:polar amino acid transport system substrate-binding protein